MAPELLNTFSSAAREETFSQNILSQRWANLSFVRIYVRKFCLFAGWAASWKATKFQQSAEVIAVWLLMCVCQHLVPLLLSAHFMSS